MILFRDRIPPNTQAKHISKPTELGAIGIAALNICEMRHFNTMYEPCLCSNRFEAKNRCPKAGSLTVATQFQI